MPTDLASTLLVLVVSGVVVVDGQIIRAKGRTYLRAAYPDHDVAESVNLLITALFHLVALGILTLLMASPTGAPNVIQDFETRLGVALLVVAVAHGAAMLTLRRVRAHHADTQLQKHLTPRYMRAPSEEKLTRTEQQRPDLPERDGVNSSDSDDASAHIIADNA